MGSPFDDLMEQADASLFDQFGQHATYYATSGPLACRVIVERDVVLSDGHGPLVCAERTADLRQSEVPDPRRGDRLDLTEQGQTRAWRLDQWLASDGLINRYSLIPAD